MPGNFTLFQPGGGGSSSGSGFGGINYITNPSAATTVSPWVTYANTPGSIPINGTGGSPSITLTRDTTSLTIGTTSFLITKGATNRQGDGVSCDFTIDTAVRNTALSVSMYINASANFTFSNVSGTVVSDVTAYVYDTTNNILVSVFPNVFTSNLGQFQAQFQATSSLTYRLILHIGTTNALAWTFAFGNVVVTPVNNVYIQDDSDFTNNTTFTIGASTTPPTPGTNTRSLLTKKNGSNLDFVFNFAQTVAGSAGSGIYLIPLPDGISINTNIIVTSTNAGGHPATVIGSGSLSNVTTGASASRTGNVYAYNSTNLMLIVDGATADVQVPWGSANFALSGSTIYASFNGTVPILGWSSGYPTPGTSAQNIQAVMSAYKTGGSITANTTIDTWVTREDSAGAFNASAGTYTVRQPGTYTGTFTLFTTAATTSLLAVRVNGNIVQFGAGTASQDVKTFAFQLANLNVNDVVTFTTNTNSTAGSSTTGTAISLSRVLSPNSLLIIPKSITYTAKISSAGVVSDMTSSFGASNWITGNAVISGTSVFTVTLNTSVFRSGQTINASAVVNDTGTTAAIRYAQMNSMSTTSVSYVTVSQSSSTTALTTYGAILTVVATT